MDNDCSSSYASPFDQALDFIEDQLMLDPVADEERFDMETVYDLIRKYPGLAKTPIFNGDGSLLQLVLRHQPPLEIVKFLYEAGEPQAIQQADGMGFTPLHHACCYPSSFDVVKYIVSLYPRALLAHSNYGGTPVEVLCQDSRNSIETLKFLTTTYPECIASMKRCYHPQGELYGGCSSLEIGDASTDGCHDDGDDSEDHDDRFGLLEELIVGNQAPEKIKVLLDAYPSERLSLHLAIDTLNGTDFSNSSEFFEHGSSDMFGNSDDTKETSNSSSSDDGEFRGINASIGAMIGSCGKGGNRVGALDCQGCTFTVEGYKALFESLGTKQKKKQEEQKPPLPTVITVADNTNQENGSDPKNKKQKKSKWMPNRLHNFVTSTLRGRKQQQDEEQLVEENILQDTKEVATLVGKEMHPDEQENEGELLTGGLKKLSLPIHEEEIRMDRKSVADAFERMITTNTSLQSLSIQIISEDWSMGGRSDRSGNNNKEEETVGSLVGRALARGLPKNHTLKELKVSVLSNSALEMGNKDGCLGYENLWRIIQDGASVESFHFDGVACCGPSLVKGLKKRRQTSHPTLRALSISNCRVAPKHTHEIIRILASSYKDYLRSFHLHDDRDLSSSSKEETVLKPESLAGLLSLSHLEDLFISLRCGGQYAKDQQSQASTRLHRLAWLGHFVLPCFHKASLRSFAFHGIQWREQDEIDQLGHALRESKMKSLSLDFPTTAGICSLSMGSTASTTLRGKPTSQNGKNCLDYGSFVEALGEENCHLESIGGLLGIGDGLPCFKDCCLWKRELKNYCILNWAGRKHTRKVDAKKEDVVAVLCEVSDDPTLSYIVLRDIPHLWS